VLEREGLEAGGYFLVSLHREETVDYPSRLASVLEALNSLTQEYDLPVLVSTHPRTKKRLEDQPISLTAGLQFHAPFGFNDYVRLQLNARLVLSDSGTISEESSILEFAAVTLRDAIERPEALDAGAIITAGVSKAGILEAVQAARYLNRTTAASIPPAYLNSDTSRRVVSYILVPLPATKRGRG
jgi:UDP-N-acetylglucosamine 2-epimerase